MWRWFQRWSDRRAIRRWIRSAGEDPIRALTVGEEHELMELLAKLAREAPPILATEEPRGDLAEASASDDAKWPGSNPLEPDERYWYSDDWDAYARDVCVKRFGPI